MDGGMLSQEEINALLAGADKGSGDSSSAADSEDVPQNVGSGFSSGFSSSVGR